MNDNFIIAGKKTAKKLLIYSAVILLAAYVIAIPFGYIFGKHFYNGSDIDFSIIDLVVYWIEKILLYLSFGITVFALSKKGVNPLFPILFSTLTCMQPLIYSVMQLFEGKKYFGETMSFNLWIDGWYGSLSNLVSFGILLLAVLFVWMYHKNGSSYRYTAIAHILDVRSLAILSIIFHAGFYLVWFVINLFLSIQSNENIVQVFLTLIPILLGYFIMTLSCAYLEKQYRKEL